MTPEARFPHCAFPGCRLPDWHTDDHGGQLRLVQRYEYLKGLCEASGGECICVAHSLYVDSFTGRTIQLCYDHEAELVDQRALDILHQYQAGACA
jgi:hypothetical protein